MDGDSNDNLPIDNVEPMKMLQRAEKLSRVETATVLIELAFALQMVEQFTAID